MTIPDQLRIPPFHHNSPNTLLPFTHHLIIPATASTSHINFQSPCSWTTMQNSYSCVRLTCPGPTSIVSNLERRYFLFQQTYYTTGVITPIEVRGTTESDDLRYRNWTRSIRLTRIILVYTLRFLEVMIYLDEGSRLALASAVQYTGGRMGVDC